MVAWRQDNINKDNLMIASAQGLLARINPFTLTICICICLVGQPCIDHRKCLTGLIWTYSTGRHLLTPFPEIRKLPEVNY